MPHSAWPRLDYEADASTYETLHLFTQVVGKVRMARMPWIAHAWHVPLYLSPRGLTTSLIPADGPSGVGFEVVFDFIAHQLAITTDRGEERRIALGQPSVAAFYEALMTALADLGAATEIWPVPVELPDPVTPFGQDAAPRDYDAEAAERLWRALAQVHRVLVRFRAGFAGKVSPVHFFWGAFDLAVTRFSGREAPRHPGGVPNCADWVMEDAYAREVSSAGFWPGAGLGEAAFYSYAYPEPGGFREADIQPGAAYFHESLGEYVLPYAAVREAEDPDAALLAFLESTYAAAADLASWDRARLEGPTPIIVT